jgi:hypothetical protein
MLFFGEICKYSVKKSGIRHDEFCSKYCTNLLKYIPIDKSVTVREICVFILFISIQNIQAMDTEITLKEVEARLGGEYSRSHDFYGDISAIGAVELNNRLAVKTGFSAGMTRDVTDIKAFSGARLRLLEKWPLGLGLSWIYNGLPEYKAHSHTLLPCFSWYAKYGGITIGPSFRFTSFFNEPAIFESTLSISVFVNFINNEKIRIGAILANFNDFQTSNFGHYLLCLNSALRINRRWTLLNEVEATQSGGDGLSAVFYGLAMRGGVKFTW